MSNTANWILKNGSLTQNCTSFPYAYRAAYNLIRKAIEAKQNPATVMKGISIVGPPNGKGERTSYSYTAATQLARENGLLSGEGTGSINSREFKKR
jgi:hypothetical protein